MSRIWLGELQLLILFNLSLKTDFVIVKVTFCVSLFILLDPIYDNFFLY